MERWTFCMAMTVALLFAGTAELFAQGLTIQITNCPKTVKAGRDLDSSFKVMVVNDGETAVKDVPLQFVLKTKAECPALARHALYSPNFFDGVLLRGGRESVSLAPKQKLTIRPHGANTIPLDTPAGKTYYLCAVVVAGDKESNVGDGKNCSCCPIRVTGVEERPAITGYGETCVNRRGTITIIGRNFGSSEGKVVYLAGSGISVNLPVVSWSDSAIVAQIPDNPNIRGGQLYFAGIRKAESGELLANASVYISVCPERRTMPEPTPAAPPAPPFLHQ